MNAPRAIASPVTRPSQSSTAAAGVFCLRRPQTRHRLLPMASRSPIRVSARAGESLSRLASSPRTRSGSRPGGCSDDTLHCGLDVGGSAAQFNRSVSAVPPPPSRTFETPVHSGTADTLLLRSA
jgi:hypothetical protein